MRIYIASDHAGFQLKKQLVQYLKIKGVDVEDFGPFEIDPDDDYPDFIIPCAQKVANEIAQGKDVRGIIIGGSGQGEAIAANKVKGIRTALFYGGNLDIVKFSREHNDTNILSFGARFIAPDQAKMAVSMWLDTGFDQASRHQRRHDKIKAFEENK